VVAALFAQSSGALAQDNTDEKADGNTDDKAAPDKAAPADPPAAPDKVAQAEPAPPPGPDQPGSAGPSQPGTRPGPDDMRKMIQEEVAKMRPKGPALEFAGYARAGVGLAIKGGKEVCFVLNGADTKWRLGNECDYVIEPQFTGRLVQRDDGSNWGVVVMPGLYRTWDGAGPAFNDVPTVFRQIYFFGENVPELLHGRVWGGRRYYDRLHLDINDQFLEIHDSDGAGLEDMQVGQGKLSVAFLMNPNIEANTVPNPTMGGAPIATGNLAPWKLNVRYTGIKTAPEGELQIWAGIHGSSTSEDQIDMGVGEPAAPDTLYRIGVYHTLNKVLNGNNLVGAKIEYTKNHFLWRAVVQQQMQLNNGRTAVDVIGEFRSTRDTQASGDKATFNWLSLGARADTQISGPFRFLLEAGIDRVFAPTDADSTQLFKVTPCLAVSAGDSNGSRPTFRLFYTHGFWNDAAKTSPLGVFTGGTSGTRAGQIYGNANNGGSFGLQAEAWW
jgi:maltoporin